MQIRTQREVIKNVADNWNHQYKNWPTKQEPCPIKAEIGRKLSELDLETVSAKEVNKIIGNSAWTALNCSECEKSVDWVLEVGEVPEYESSTAYLCKECIRKAANLIV